MNLKYLAVVTDIIFIPSSLHEVDKNKTEIVGFEDWKDARDFLEQAARDHGDLIGNTIESGVSNNSRHTYAIWEYDPDGEGGDRFYRATPFWLGGKFMCLGFKIYLTHKCFREKRGCGELFEKLEDAMANILAEYGLEGRICDNITGNITVFQPDRDDNEQKYHKHNDVDSVLIESSHGVFYADVATGEILGKEICCDKQPRQESCNGEYTQIKKFDFDEWKGYYKKDKIDVAVDILDLGYWLTNGNYTSAEEDFRKDIKAG